MRNLRNKLKNKELVYDKLLKYGFTNEKGEYTYKTIICNGQFEMCVTFSKEQATSKLIDIANEDEYILIDIQETTGEFVGKVREEYEQKLQDIISNCTTPNIFKSSQAKEVIKYIKDKYNDDLEFLWKKFDNNAIWRNKTNNKWYGLLLTITANKLKIDSTDEMEIIDLRYQKEAVDNIVDNKNVFPGYHMNKKSWITIKLDNTVETKRILKLIDNSYNLSLEKPTKIKR